MIQSGQSQSVWWQEKEWGPDLVWGPLVSCVELPSLQPQCAAMMHSVLLRFSFPCFNFDGGQVELGVFGACSRCTKSEVSQRGITACPSNYLELIVFLWFLAPSVGAVHVRASQSEDLANQVRHWVTYTSLVRKAGKQPGTFVSPAAAEWFSGLRCMFHDGKTTERY